VRLDRKEHRFREINAPGDFSKIGAKGRKSIPGRLSLLPPAICP
jgi:hypothetical protein